MYEHCMDNTTALRQHYHPLESFHRWKKLADEAVLNKAKLVAKNEAYKRLIEMGMSKAFAWNVVYSS